ncbi:tetratricopeptide repeat protein [Gynuella sunshinyii]|uniref:Putative Zn-dependent protease, contains TPR repeats n=1 Tax=Gynuella sunshinyii YC6258 TaxID=1445510 RepID=A0A0C5VNZ9_9GAMM|nr:tetratricopeptide repeat protein [Gynuella sunshinyii]AJQ95123.1 putative Zn-dependent protease, contains TPR repeats [Gynuella sunshinyii YC6258]
MSRILILLIITVFSQIARAEDQPPVSPEQLEKTVDQLQEPLYTPFIERYVLDELKQLRTDMAAQRVDLIQQVTDRENRAADRALTYATDTVTYFFYLIAAASSILVLVGWTSVRDMKEKVQALADEKISELIGEYEARLHMVESQLNEEAMLTKQNREEIELTKEIQSLWMRAQQDGIPANKILVYDQILSLRPDDCEALTYKADAVLELGEPQWAINLCRQALIIDPDNCHAFYQLACAHTARGNYDDAIRYLSEVTERTSNYREDILADEALKPLWNLDSFKDLIGLQSSA